MKPMNRTRTLAVAAALLLALSPTVAMADEDDDKDEDEDPRLAAIKLDDYQSDGNPFTGMTFRGSRTLSGETFDKVFQAAARAFIDSGYNLSNNDAKLGILSGTSSSLQTVSVEVDRVDKGVKVRFSISGAGFINAANAETRVKTFFLHLDERLGRQQNR